MIFFVVPASCYLLVANPVLLWVTDSGLGERTDEEDQSNPPYINNAPMGFCLKKKEGHRKRCICMYGDGQGTSYLTLGHILVMFVMHSCVRSFLLGESLCLGLLHLKPIIGPIN
jgi:hypothetical protein